MYVVIILRIQHEPFITECTKWLGEHEIPTEDFGVLISLHLGFLNQNVRRVGRELIQAHGPGHNDGALWRYLQRVHLHQEAGESVGQEKK